MTHTVNQLKITQQPIMSQKIVYIDDDPNLCELVEAILEMEGGFDVKTFTDGNLALEALKSAQPQLILTDVSMPGLDGPELFQLIRDQDISCPIVFVTSFNDEARLSQLQTLGAAGIIVKPIKPSPLIEEVKAHLSDS